MALNGKCGTVSASGQIVSNGNFSCTYTNTNTYTVSYNGNVNNPVPVVSLVNQNPTAMYVLNAYSGGFTLYVYIDNGGTPTPAASNFNFIVAEI